MKRSVWWAIALATVGPQLVWSEEEEYLPEPVGATVSERDGVTVYEAILPGDLVDWDGLPRVDGSEGMVLLTEDEEDESSTALESGQRHVWMWRLMGEGALEKVGQPLPEEATGVVAFSYPGSGDVEVLVTVGGKLMGIGGGGGWVERFSSDHELFPVLDSRGGRPSSTGRFMLRSIGQLRALEIDRSARSVNSLWTLDLPLTVDREWGALRLETPPIAILEGQEGGATRLVMGPQVQGKRRIRSTLITTDLQDAPESVETWNMLTNLEDVEESWYVTYQGSPAIIVTTVLADKHGVFEKKKLRLFVLTADRTRAGSGPLLEAMTRSRNWYGTCAGVADVNGDGVDDLVSAQPKGLGAGSLWVEAHLGIAGGGFDKRVRGSEIDVEEGEVCTLAVDVVGDERVDLVVVEGDTLLVFPILVAIDAQTVVGPDPQYRVSFDDISGRPRPFDPLGPSGSRLVVTGRTKGKRQAVRLVRFP